MIERNQVHHVLSERYALTLLNNFYHQNPWVTRLYCSFQDALYLYFVMEYVPGGDMMSQLMKLEVFTEAETRFYIAELVLAVASVHRVSFIHRDIKPDNILIDINGHIKLSNFGLSTGLSPEDRVITPRSIIDGKPDKNTNDNTPITDTPMDKTDRPHLSALKKDERFSSWKCKRRVLAHSEVGTPDYMAPDVLNPKGEGYGQEADWWSVGIIMFEMLAGFPPFYSDDTDATSTFEKILEWKSYIDEAISEVNLSSEAEDLIRQFCCDKKDRIGRGGVEEIKNHPFFKGIDWDNIRSSDGPFVPKLDHPKDTSNFPEYEIDVDVADWIKQEMLKMEIEDKIYPRWRGRRLRQNDIPFIGFTYKNIEEAMDALLINDEDKRKH